MNITPIRVTIEKTLFHIVLLEFNTFHLFSLKRTGRNMEVHLLKYTFTNHQYISDERWKARNGYFWLKWLLFILTKTTFYSIILIYGWGTLLPDIHCMYKLSDIHTVNILLSISACLISIPSLIDYYLSWCVPFKRINTEVLPLWWEGGLFNEDNEN